MDTRHHWLLAGIVFVGLTGASGAAAEDAQTTAPHGQVETVYGKLSLTFEANYGQVDAQVKYLSRGQGYTLFLTPGEAVLTLRPAGAPGETGRQGDRERVDPETLTLASSPPLSLSPTHPVTPSAVVRMKLIDANAQAEVSGEAEQPGKVHYLRGDRSQWRTNVPTYGKVRYTDIYPGIDLVYYSNSQGKLEDDFVVAPGADPATIRLAFASVEARCNVSLRIDDSGDLLLSTAGGTSACINPKSTKTSTVSDSLSPAIIFFLLSR